MGIIKSIHIYILVLLVFPSCEFTYNNSSKNRVNSNNLEEGYWVYSFLDEDSIKQKQEGSYSDGLKKGLWKYYIKDEVVQQTWKEYNLKEYDIKFNITEEMRIRKASSFYLINFKENQKDYISIIIHNDSNINTIMDYFEKNIY